ncbi:MAG: UDP-N-acetylmuramate--L-alanine ligase [Sphingobacteriales bacterium]|nr:MAG: UDP-N-acetylmuramate--L-alanine ligase [Sphingobacteriales bacterium]
MQISSIKKVYFLGIGGIGMSALARYFNFHGVIVKGYDKTATVLTQELEKEGIEITFNDSVDTLMKDVDLVVLTPAIPKDSIQLDYYKQSNIPLLKRAEVLGLIANSSFNISIAGSHGKTSTSSITAHILHSAQKNVAAFLGGIALNYNSNFINGTEYAIAEADEFDRSFLNLSPNIALITSVDTDHLDIYGNLSAIEDAFHQFCNKIQNDGICIAHQSVKENILNHKVRNLRYSLANQQSDYYTKNLRIENQSYIFDVVHPNGIVENVVSYYGGKHNVENAVGAIAIALNIGISDNDIKQAIGTFKGVKRRFETHVKNDKYVYIDDYAHHPRELDATISAAKELYPDKKITVVFQPHLFSRTKDLAEEFATSLSKVDELILLDIYPAREKPIEGVTSKIIFDNVSLNNKYLLSKDDLIAFIDKNKNSIEVILTVGAGDIDTKITDIKRILN